MAEDTNNAQHLKMQLPIQVNSWLSIPNILRIFRLKTQAHHRC